MPVQKPFRMHAVNLVVIYFISWLISVFLLQKKKEYDYRIAKVQKELSINGDGLAVFSLDKETVFEVKVGSAIVNLSPLVNANLELTNQDTINPIDNNKKVKTPYPSSFEKIKNKFTSKSIMILGFCKEQPLTKSMLLPFFEQLPVCS